MSESDDLSASILAHIRHLSLDIGARGSCTPPELEAARYAAGQMGQMGAQDAHIEPYQGSPSTYRPYALAFTAGLLGILVAWLARTQWGMAIAAVLSGLGAWGMLAETDLGSNWMRLLLPTATSHNAVGVIPAARPATRRVILCAHLDTHRTPVFYSSLTWNRLFSLLVGGAWVSMVVAALAFAAGAFLGWGGARWIGLVAAAVELFALALCIHADFTPHSPGANDNASGVAVALALAQRLVKEALAQTEVWLAFTGCEEVGAYGAAAFLDSHGQELGRDAFFVILDQVGAGGLTYLTADGLIWKHKTHPAALDLARQATATLPGLGVREHVGLAYTDALVATKRGLPALTLNTVPRSASQAGAHWHQMSDTVAHVEPKSLSDTLAFAWQLLQGLDNTKS